MPVSVGIGRRTMAGLPAAAVAVAPPAPADQTSGYPTFSGPALPAEPVAYTPGANQNGSRGTQTT